MRRRVLRRPIPLLSQEDRQSVASLSEAVLSLRPLVDVLRHPVQVPLGEQGERLRWLLREPTPGCLGAIQMLNRLGKRLGAPPFELDRGIDSNDPGVFAHIVANRLATAPHPESVPVGFLSEFDAIADEVVACSFERKCICSEAPSSDGVPLRIYAAGDRRNPSVVMASACGMPAKLCFPWIRFLAQEYYVITWETRGLFGASSDFVGADCSVNAQASDLLAAMDHLGVQQGHLMGMCGGAVIALAAAARHPERFLSLSLWHGDFELGPDCPKTDHQRNLKALMAIAAEGHLHPDDVHKVICQSIGSQARHHLAHLILYPYATGELLVRYCKLNGSIMDYDVRPLLPRLTLSCLAVTSRDDETAHPAGTRAVAALLPQATVHVEPHGDHVSLFSAHDGLMRLAGRFIRGQSLSQRRASAVRASG